MDKIRENLAAFQIRASNWVFACIVRLEIHAVRYEPLTGSSYIPPPKKLASTNVDVTTNKDASPNALLQKMFKWFLQHPMHLPIIKRTSVL